MPGSSRATYAEAAIAEVRRARAALGDRDLPVSTVFFGGGTPTLLEPDDLTSVVAAIDAEFGLVAGAEVTTEANPDSVSAAGLARLREGGVNRVSFGMQSAVDHVLRVLDRTHDPRRVPEVVAWARAAGFDQVSLDLIYGTPGESLADWERSLDEALACEPDHVSAYSLIVEEGTALARRVRRGELPMPDEDDLADKYLLADQRLEAAGLGWYELSNWARDSRTTRRPSAGTTSSTGPAATGGASARAPTRTWPGRGGGTSSTPRRTPSGWPPGGARPRTTRCSTTRPGGSSGCCWSCGCGPACRWTALDATGLAAVPGLEADGLLEATGGPAGADPAGSAAGRRGGPGPAALTCP